MNALETRLTEALHARADQLGPDDLVPAHVPATATPLPRRRPVLMVVAGVAAAAVVAAVVVLGTTGDEQSQRTPVATDPPSATPTTPDGQEPPEPSRTRPPLLDLDDLVPEDEFGIANPGEVVTFDDGTTALIDGDELVVTADGEARSAPMPEISGSAGLWRVRLPANSGVFGYVVYDGGGESAALTVYVPDTEGGLTVAEVTGRAPFGTSYAEGLGGNITWTTDDGARLFTRDSVGDASENRFRLYEWSISGPQSPVELVPVDHGVICYDYAARTATRC